MRHALVAILLTILVALPAVAQTGREADVRARFPYDRLAMQIPGLSVEDYEAAMRILAQMADLSALVARMPIVPAAAASAASLARSSSTAVSLRYPPPPRPATPPVPRMTYPTTRNLYQWEAAHLR